MKRHQALRSQAIFGTPKKRGNKYSAKRCKYNGYTYDSRAEAAYARELDLRLAAGEFIGWERQYRVEIWAHDRHGDPKIKITHKIDFRIEHHDGSFELVEVKGLETADYRQRRRFLEALWLPDHPDHRYTVVRV